MELILLPGLSKENKKWIHELSAIFKNNFDTIHVHEYLHWENEQITPTIEKELECVAAYAKNISQYVIFGKSFGAIVALQGIRSRKLKPVACLFVGVAGNMSRQTPFPIEELLTNYSVPTLFVQKEFDPAFPSAELKEVISIAGAKKTRVVSIPGSDHWYADLNQLQRDMESLLQGIAD